MRRISDTLDEIPQVVSSSGGFYNPSKSNFRGEFYLDFNQGMPKAVSFKYTGEIRVEISDSIIGANIINYKVKKIINIRFTPDSKITDDLLFTFTGNIYTVKGLKIYNWRGKPFSPKFINYDQINVFMNYSKTNLEDDTILIEDEGIINKYRDYTPKVSVRQHPSFGRFENLPESYVIESENLNQRCKNCHHWRNGYCELWDARVMPQAWCGSWKKKGIK